MTRRRPASTRALEDPGHSRTAVALGLDDHRRRAHQIASGAANTGGRFVLAISPLRSGVGLHRVRVIFRPTDTRSYLSTTTLNSPGQT
jgi:hypothetical protein